MSDGSDRGPGSLLEQQSSWLAVCRMIDTIIGGNQPNVVGIHSFKAANVVPVLLGIGPALMVRVDPAVGAELVPGCACIELVQLQCILTLQDPDAG